MQKTQTGPGKISNSDQLPIAILEILPNPVLVKDGRLRYVWVNPAFEQLFDVDASDLCGRLYNDVFTDRQATQCNGGDLRVLESGEVEEACETIVNAHGESRETLTRKSRLVVDGDPYLVGVMHDITELVRANELLETQSAELEALADTDSLTGCLTRRALVKHWEQCAVSPKGHGVLMIDVDDFKEVNDNFGHGVGDSTLRHLALIARSVLGPEALLSRYGGEEFVAILPGLTLKEATDMGEQLRDSVSRSQQQVETGTISVTISVGIAHTTMPGRGELDRSISRADRNLYLAKQQGRNRALAA